jgi:copper chaperone CopZ
MSERTITMKVAGWGCEGCSGATEDALRKQPGVRSAKADLARGSVEITFDEAAVGLPQLEKAVRDAGYQPVG